MIQRDAGAILQSQLSALESRGLIHRNRTEPSPEYSFRHTLMHEAMYSMLLREYRREVHHAVGAALEDLNPGRLDELSDRIGEHYYQAGEKGMAKAFEYLRKAGDRAFRNYAIPEAVAHYRRALEISSQLDADTETRIHLSLSLGRALELDAKYEGALAVYNAMHEDALQAGDRPLELAALMATAILRSVVSPVFDPAAALGIAEQALALARELEDQAAEARVRWIMLLANTYAANIPQAIVHGEESLKLARQLNLKEQLAYTLHDLTMAYMQDGRIDQSQVLRDEVERQWMELDNRAMLVDARSQISIVDYSLGEFDRVLERSDETYELARSIENLWGQSQSRVGAALVYGAMGEADRAIQIWTEAVQQAEMAGLVPGIVFMQAELGWRLAFLGRVDEALEVVYKSHKLARQEFPRFEAWPQAIGVRVLLSQARVGEATDLIGDLRARPRSKLMHDLIPPGLGQVVQAVAEFSLASGDTESGLNYVLDWEDYYREIGMITFLPELLRVKAGLHLAQKEGSLGRAALQDAREVAEKLGMRSSLWPLLADLAGLERREGREDQAREWEISAMQVIEAIGDNIKIPEHRRTFLAQPSVRRALNPEAED